MNDEYAKRREEAKQMLAERAEEIAAMTRPAEEILADRLRVDVSELSRSEAKRIRNQQQAVLRSTQIRAWRKGVHFSLKIDDVKIPEFCPVLGIPLRKPGEPRDRDRSPTIARIRLDRGFTPKNIIVVSWRANVLRGNGTAEEHRALADALSALGNDPYLLDDLAESVPVRITKSPSEFDWLDEEDLPVKPDLNLDAQRFNAKSRKA